MNGHPSTRARNSQEQFRLRFEQRLRALLASHSSTAEGFGLAWGATLEEVPLAEENQAAVYWQLIRWAANDELFTATREQQLLEAWSDTVHEC